MELRTEAADIKTMLCDGLPNVGTKFSGKSIILTLISSQTKPCKHTTDKKIFEYVLPLSQILKKCSDVHRKKLNSLNESRPDSISIEPNSGISITVKPCLSNNPVVAKDGGVSSSLDESTDLSFITAFH